jgi:hypothetical protein
MAGKTDVVRAGSTIGGEAARAHDEREGRCDEQLLHLLYP